MALRCPLRSNTWNASHTQSISFCWKKWKLILTFLSRFLIIWFSGFQIFEIRKRSSKAGRVRSVSGVVPGLPCWLLFRSLCDGSWLLVIIFLISFLWGTVVIYLLRGCLPSGHWFSLRGALWLCFRRQIRISSHQQWRAHSWRNRWRRGLLQ